MEQELKDPLIPHLERNPTATHSVYFSLLGSEGTLQLWSYRHSMSFVLDCSPEPGSFGKKKTFSLCGRRVKIAAELWVVTPGHAGDSQPD